MREQFGKKDDAEIEKLEAEIRDLEARKAEILSRRVADRSAGQDDAMTITRFETQIAAKRAEILGMRNSIPMRPTRDPEGK